MAHLGSFAAPLALPEALRPWAQSGLSALYLPGGLPVQEPAAGSAPAPAGTAAAQQPQAPRWPEPWRGLAARLREKPRVIITYTDLALDLSGTPHPGRRKLLRDILGYLAWPQGTSLFWPASALKDGKTCPAPEPFLAGVRHFGVAHVVCLGADSAEFCRALLAAEEGVRVLELPAPQALLQLLPHELHLAAKPLKALVTG